MLDMLGVTFPDYVSEAMAWLQRQSTGSRES